MIKLNQVSKVIKGTEVLKEVDLVLKPGTCVMIHGHNGSGKTMLLRLIARLIKPTSGTIQYEASYRFGVIIENPTFFLQESALYNLKYLAGINQMISETTIINWLKTFNLDEVKHKKVKTFSLGMRQRLALCQAFMEEPDVILLDEPFNGVDEGNLEKIYQIIDQMKQKGTLIVIASHVKVPVEGLIDEEIKLSDGKMIERRS